MMPFENYKLSEEESKKFSDGFVEHLRLKREKHQLFLKEFNFNQLKLRLETENQITNDPYGNKDDAELANTIFEAVVEFAEYEVDKEECDDFSERTIYYNGLAIFSMHGQGMFISVELDKREAKEEEPLIVYQVIRNGWEDFDIVGTFRTKEKAQRLMEDCVRYEIDNPYPNCSLNDISAEVYNKQWMF
jgi:hypothetical protein